MIIKQLITGMHSVYMVTTVTPFPSSKLDTPLQRLSRIGSIHLRSFIGCLIRALGLLSEDEATCAKLVGLGKHFFCTGKTPSSAEKVFVCSHSYSMPPLGLAQS